MRRLYWFAAFLVLYEFTVYSANDMIMPGMLDVVTSFNASITYVASSLSLYMLGECVLQLWLGPLADRYGKRQIILIGNFSFLIFTLIIATSMNIQQFMIGRWLQGSGMAFIAMGYALIHEKFNDTQAIKLLSLLGNVGLLAPLIGPLIGSIIVSHYSWRYIFALGLILGSISLLGLYFTVPKSTLQPVKLNFKSICKQYKQIISSKNYLLGIFAPLIMAIPLILWIGFAPNIVLHNLKLNYEVFIICQIIAIGGLSISSIFVQFLAGKWKFYHLIKRGSYISLSGIILALIGHSSIYVLASGLCVYSIGVGLGNGSMIRITMRSQKNSSQAMVTSLMTFLQTLVFAIVIEAANHILALYNYSPLSFCLACLLSVIIGFMLTRKFAKRHKDREWE